MRSLLTFISVLLIVLGSCKPQQKSLSSGDLFELNEISSTISNDTIHIKFQDDSYIGDKNYNSLKTNLFVYLNADELDKYGLIVVEGLQKKEAFDFKQSYNKQDLNFIKNLFDTQPMFRSSVEHLTTNFDATDWWALVNAYKSVQMQRKQKLGNSPIDLIYNFCQVSDKELEKSEPHEILKQTAQTIKNSKVTDFFKPEIVIPSKKVLKKFNYFLSLRNMEPVN